MFKKLQIILVLMIMGGCTSPKPPNPPEPPIEETNIADVYFSIYTNQVNVSHITLSSMFKYYLEGEISTSWDKAYNHLDSYVGQSTNMYINVNYPVKATYNEGMLLWELGNDVIEYGYENEFEAVNHRNNFKHISIDLIRKMNEYEYNRYR